MKELFEIAADGTILDRSIDAFKGIDTKTCRGDEYGLSYLKKIYDILGKVDKKSLHNLCKIYQSCRERCKNNGFVLPFKSMMIGNLIIRGRNIYEEILHDENKRCEFFKVDEQKYACNIVYFFRPHNLNQGFIVNSPVMNRWNTAFTKVA